MDWLIEDIVAEQTQKNKDETAGAIKKKYMNLDLSDLMAMRMVSMKDKLKLSEKEQDMVMKLSLNETKLDELEKQLADMDDNEDEATVDLFVVIDISYSMEGEKLKEVKESLGFLVELLKKNDRISFVTFDTHSEYLMAPKLIGESREQIDAAINYLHVQGSTNIGKGIETTFKAMVDRKSKNQVTGILLLSDGHDNQWWRKGGPVVDKFFEEWTPKLKDHPYTIHTYGYGADHDADIMDQIAKLNGGAFHYVHDIANVSDSFADYLGGLCSVIGRDAKIDLKLNMTDLFPEIRFKKTYGRQFSGDKETLRTINVNNILKGCAKDFIFELTLNGVKDAECIESEPSNMKFVSATLIMENLSGKEYRITEDFAIDVYNESSKIEIIENTDVKKHVVRTKAADIIEMAQDCCDNRSYAHAEDLLSAMENECDQYDDDEMFNQLKTNLGKQKAMVRNEKEGKRNSMNMKAYAMNSANCYAMQESSPCMAKGMFQNASRQKRTAKMNFLKSGF